MHSPRANCAQARRLLDSHFARRPAAMAEPKYLYPRLSLAERDRRWNAVRDLLDREYLDCLITPNNTGHSMHFQAESRYLTHCGGGGDADIACVFPLRGEVAAIATSCDRWRDVQNWVTD